VKGVPVDSLSPFCLSCGDESEQGTLRGRQEWVRMCADLLKEGEGRLVVAKLNEGNSNLTTDYFVWATAKTVIPGNSKSSYPEQLFRELWKFGAQSDLPEIGTLATVPEE